MNRFKIGSICSNHAHTGPSIGAAPTGDTKHKTPRPSKFDNRTCLKTYFSSATVATCLLSDRMDPEGLKVAKWEFVKMKLKDSDGFWSSPITAHHMPVLSQCLQSRHWSITHLLRPINATPMKRLKAWTVKCTKRSTAMASSRWHFGTTTVMSPRLDWGLPKTGSGIELFASVAGNHSNVKHLDLELISTLLIQMLNQYYRVNIAHKPYTPP